MTMGGANRGGVPIRRPSSSGTGSTFVPTAEQVEELVRAIPYGETRSVKDLRLDLADGQGADSTCAVATGRHLRNLAQSVSEQLAAGASVDEVAPSLEGAGRDLAAAAPVGWRVQAAGVAPARRGAGCAR